MSDTSIARTCKYTRTLYYQSLIKENEISNSIPHQFPQGIPCGEGKGATKCPQHSGCNVQCFLVVMDILLIHRE